MGLGLLATVPAVAQTTLQSGAQVQRVDIDRQRDSVVIGLTLDLTPMQVDANRSVVMQPFLTADGHEHWMPAVEVMGRRNYLYARRNDGKTYADSRNLYQALRKENDDAQTVDYRVALPYESWMDRAELQMAEDLCGCGEVEDMPQTPLGVADVAFRPALAYVSPQAVTRKTRELKGTAYLDFPVNKTTIYPDYRRNPSELAKIRATIDTVRHDPDATIASISIKGFASPEGTWRLNTRLAKGRTEALKRYVIDRYNFSDTLFTTAYEPENWEGLRAYVLQTGLRDKQQIVDLIDSPLEPDPKEARLKREHPESYRMLLDECYPGLRRSDYVVTYVIRGFNVDEARQIIRTQPQKLSLQEMFAVAQTYEPGSQEFNHVFDVAVRLYPDDPVANLNAANALLEQGRAAEAQPYLDKAGTSPQAQNARAVCLLLQHRYDEALPLLQAAQDAGLKEAAENCKIYGTE